MNEIFDIRKSLKMKRELLNAKNFLNNLKLSFASGFNHLLELSVFCVSKKSSKFFLDTLASHNFWSFPWAFLRLITISISPIALLFSAWLTFPKPPIHRKTSKKILASVYDSKLNAGIPTKVSIQQKITHLNVITRISRLDHTKLSYPSKTVSIQLQTSKAHLSCHFTSL